MDLKPSTTIDEQLVLIEGKGIHINDMQAARDFLRRTGYYRLRAYFLPFKTRTGYARYPSTRSCAYTISTANCGYGCSTS